MATLHDLGDHGATPTTSDTVATSAVTASAAASRVLAAAG
jgi:hypothetical protein